MVKKPAVVAKCLIALLLLTSTTPLLAACDWGCYADRLTRAGENHRQSGNWIRGIVGALEGGIELAMDGLDWLFDISGVAPIGGGSDPDYNIPASLSGRAEVQLFDGDGETTVLVNAALVQVGLTFDNARLANSSVRKYHGAIEAGDHNAASQRTVEGRVYLDALESNIEDLANTLLLLSDELDATGVDLPPISFQELLDFRSDVIANGYPQYEIDMAERMLISDEEMQGMLYVFEHRGLPGVGPEDINDDLLRQTAAQLQSVDLRANLPVAFQ